MCVIPSNTCSLSVSPPSGYEEGTFDLFWRKQETDGPTEEKVSLDWKSTATLHEMGMPSDPVKSYLLITEKDGTAPRRLQQVRGCVSVFI